MFFKWYSSKFGTFPSGANIILLQLYQCKCSEGQECQSMLRTETLTVPHIIYREA